MKTFNNIIMVAVLLLGLSGLSMCQQKTTKHEYVDLGLPSGTLWATCNVGASKPPRTTAATLPGARPPQRAPTTGVPTSTLMETSKS